MKHYFDAFNRYFEISGRSTRRQYWMFYLINIIALILFLAIDIIVGFESPFFYTGYAIGAIIPCFTVAIRRMHDSGRSGWWVVVPVVNLVFLCLNGHLGRNKYGDDPNAIIQ